LPSSREFAIKQTRSQPTEGFKLSCELFNEIPVLDYTDAAAEQFEELRRLRPRIGAMDLKIAAIALSQDGLLLSANLKDFQRVPNLRVEDWTE